MSELARLYRASAHDLPMVETGSVQTICTSPPYMGLRKYDGEQDIEWPTVTYAPIAGMAAITVQGCEADCKHEWQNGKAVAIGNTPSTKNTLRGNGAKAHEKYAAANAQTVTQGAYCQKCGGWRGPLGNEPTLEAYIAHLILCAREWRRCLHDTGTLFVNLGDSYSAGGRGGQSAEKRSDNWQPTYSKAVAPPGVGPKNLLMVPSRFALAMQADGWILRSEMVWAKPNPMPESVTDRPTKAHEMIYLFSKQERYFWDADAVREPIKTENQTHYAKYAAMQSRSLKTNHARGDKGGNGTQCGFAKPDATTRNMLPSSVNSVQPCAVQLVAMKYHLPIRPGRFTIVDGPYPFECDHFYPVTKSEG